MHRKHGLGTPDNGTRPVGAGTDEKNIAGSYVNTQNCSMKAPQEPAQVAGKPTTAMDHLLDLDNSPVISTMPVTSAICVPSSGDVIVGMDKVLVKGWAYAGGGRGVTRVEVRGPLTVIGSVLLCALFSDSSAW